MSVRLYQHAEDIYLTGAGATPCLRWYRDAGRWMAEPVDLPDPATSVTVDEVPDDLREELFASLRSLVDYVEARLAEPIPDPA